MKAFKVFYFLILIMIGLSGFNFLNAEEIFLDESSLITADNLLLLELHLGRLELRDEYLTAYNPAGIILIPVEQLISYLEIPFVVDIKAGTVKGFIWNEAEEYSLDLNSAQAKANGREIFLNGHRFALTEADIYLDPEFISEWLPLELEVNTFRSILRVTPARPLPLEEKIERRFRWERLAARDYLPGQEYYPGVENPYQLFSGPFVESSFNYNYNEQGDSTNSHNTTITGDLLYLNGRLFISGPLDDPLSQISWRLGRRSPDGDLLGPVGAYEFWLGDISQPGVSDISAWTGVSGVSVSTFPYIRSSDFYSHSFQGELLEGWEVELYENTTLIDYQQSNGEEIYIFENVPINYGINEFTLVFYDQFGQKYEEVKRFLVDSSLIPPGDNRYRIDYGWDNNDENRAVISFGRGINESITLLVDYVHLPESTDLSEDYTRVGLRGSLADIFWQADYLNQIDGGWGGEIALSTNIADTYIILKHAQFDDYQSEQISNLKSRSSLDFRRAFELPLIARNLGTRLSISQEVDLDDEEAYRIYNYLSTQILGLGLSNTINYRINEVDESGSGVFRLSKRINDYRLRGELEYQLNPYEAEIIAADIYRRLDGVHNLNFRVGRNLADEINSYSLALNRNLDNYSMGVRGSYSEGDWTVGVNFSISFGRDDRTNQLKMLNSALNGAVSLKTYLDNDGEMIAVEDVAYLVNGRTAPVRTDAEGTAFISNLRSDIRNNIAIDPASLVDPFLIVETEGVSFVPRAGQTFELDFPLLMTGEIGGYIYLNDDNGLRPLSNIKINLLNSEAEILRSTLSAFDGYFYFLQLRPGDYNLEIAAESSGRRDLIQAEAAAVVIPADGGYFDGFDFILEVVE